MFRHNFSITFIKSQRLTSNLSFYAQGNIFCFVKRTWHIGAISRFEQLTLLYSCVLKEEKRQIETEF